MPRATKDTKKDELKEEKKTTKSNATAKKSTTKKATTAAKKKTTTGKTTTKKIESKTKTASKAAKSTSTKKDVKVATKSKKTSSITKKETAKKSTTKKDEIKEEKKTTKSKATAKKSTTKKAATKKTTSAKKKTTTSKAKKVDTNIVAEYYDLPYRYNETIVKILYQTPNVLFVYWDISDDDRNNFINKYGEYFFNDTKPILKIFNLTKNYSFEVEINDFANSWYINVADANCDYKVELGRKPITINENINTDYIYVSSSNALEFPNDHILLEELPSLVNFKNVKTGKITTKNISTLRLIGINKIYSVYDFYKKLYKDDILEELNNKKLLNPSSTSSWS